MRVIVVTADALSEVTWAGHPVVTPSVIAPAIEAFLATPYDFPVGDKPVADGATAGFTMELRLPQSEFEMATVLMQLPYKTSMNAKIHIHPD
jgi:hypothetical protein